MTLLDALGKGDAWHARVFVSYNFNDEELARNVLPFFQAEGGRSEGTPVFVVNDVSISGDAAIEREISRVMGPCECALFLIGAYSHNSPWVKYEARIARQLAIGIVAMKVGNRPGGLPLELSGIGVPFVDWNKEALAASLNPLRRLR